MNKKLKYLALLPLVSTLLISGCSVSKKDLKEQIRDTQTKIEDVNSKLPSVQDTSNIIDFYNKLSIQSSESFVVVKSMNSLSHSNEKVSNGIIIGASGSNYLVLVDYDSINQGNDFTTQITIKDMYGREYKNGNGLANKITIYNNKYDPTTGLGILLFREYKSPLSPIKMGELTNYYGYLTSIEQYNKVEVLDNIKSSTITINNKDYTTYDIESINEDTGSFIINLLNELSGFYSSKLNCFVSNELILDLFNLY